MEDLADLAGAVDSREPSLGAEHSALTTTLRARAICRTAVAKTLTDTAEARRLCEALDHLAASSNQPLAQAYRDHAWAAHEFQLNNDLRTAARLWMAAIDTFDANGHPEEAAISASCAMQALAYLGQFEQFTRCEHRARLFFEQTGDKLRLARVQSNSASLHTSRFEWPEAVRTFEAAYETFLRVGTPSDILATLVNLAICWMNMGDFPRADALLSRASEHAKDNGPVGRLRGIDENLAYLRFQQGDIASALQCARNAQDPSWGDSASYVAAIAEAEALLSLSLARQGEVKALQAAQGVEQRGVFYQTATALITVGRCASARLRTGLALTHYERARSIFQQIGNIAGTRICDLEVAKVCLQQGNNEEAFARAQDVLERASSDPLAFKLECELLLCRVLVERGKLEEAGARIQRLLALSSLNGQGRLEAQALQLLGRIDEAEGAPESAYAVYSRAESRFGRARRRFATAEMKAAFLADKVDFYEGLFSLGFLLKLPPQELFELAERSKSQSLSDQLLSQRARHLAPSDSGRDRELLDVSNRLQESIQRIEHMADDSPHATGGLRAARQLVFAAEEELRSLLDSPTTLPRVANAPTSASRLGERLASDVSLVEFYQARGRFYAMVISGSGLRVVELGSIAPIKHLIRLATYGFRQGTRHPEATARALSSHLADLHQLLWSPLVPIVSTQRVVIVPHGVLHSLPFHALWDGHSYLIDRHAVSYSPSAAVFYMTATRPTEPSADSVVLVGVPDSRAPAIANEVRDLAEIHVGARVLVDGYATKERLTAEIQKAKIIHIASHGLFNPVAPTESAVCVANDLLSVHDLETMQLASELVVLSGCDTGRSVLTGCDELKGLGQALLHAGARSALVSLWKVDDEVTASFMRAFHVGLREGLTRDESLKEAMRHVRREAPHPAAWAPYVLVGDPGRTVTDVTR